MIHADVATTLDRSQPKTQFSEASMLNAQAYYEAAPWARIALMKLHNVEHSLRRQTRPTAIIQVESRAAMFARTVLMALWGDNLPVPTVSPVEAGDVALIWTVGRKRIEAIFGSDLSGSFVYTDGNHILDDGEIGPQNTVALRTRLEDMECPANSVPESMRQTGMEGAWNGARKEACT